MFKTLEINNYILFEEEKMNFNSSQNVLTGKTGSGKSIFIGAIRFICGAKASKDNFFDSEKDIKVKAVINVNDGLSKRLDDLDIDYDQTIEVVRTLTPNMKNKVRLDGELISVSELKNLLEPAVDIHSQFDTIKLKNDKAYVSVVDSFIDKKVLIDYQECYSEYIKLKAQEKKLQELARNQEDQLDLIKIRLSKISEIDFSIDIDELIEKRKKYDEIRTNTKVYKQIDNLINKFSHEISNQLNNIANEEINNKINNALIELENVSYKINSETLDFNEEEYQKILEIISTAKSAMRNFNMDFSELKEYKENLEGQFKSLDSLDADLLNVQSKITKIEKEIDKKAKELTKIRTSAKIYLETEVNREIKDLEMPDTEFKIEIKDKDYSSNGIDDIKFLLKINKGNDFLEIDKSASGGELARFNLALKTITSQNRKGELIVFDEIDTGVSGSVASKMASKMMKISNNNQIVVITHLPQVAVIGNNHFELVKSNQKSKTTSHIYQLNYNQRIDNIAGLISSDKITKEAQVHAKKLLIEANEKGNYENF